jgi:hypothetical protein
MERECFLSILIALLGGITILICGWWPVGHAEKTSARDLELIRWRQLWLPLGPAVIVAAWLCGWATVEPDPVPERVPAWLLLTSVPFGLLFVRALVRAGWSLFRDEGDPGTATVGLLKPWILFSPHLAKALDERAIEAALEHERAHARHRDPLRVWLAQLATDLQWPWPQAQDRFRQWMIALELARDDEALRAGVEGSDLATAILASVRLHREAILSAGACLTGDPSVLKARIARLLAPSIDRSEESPTRVGVTLSLLVTSLLVAIGFGAVSGERVVHSLLSITA